MTPAAAFVHLPSLSTVPAGHATFDGCRFHARRHFGCRRDRNQMDANEGAAVARWRVWPLFARLTRLELAVFHPRNAARARTRPGASAKQAHARGNVRAVARLHHERADVGAAHEVCGPFALPYEIRATDGNARRGEVSDERRGEIERRTPRELSVELRDDGRLPRAAGSS